MLAAQGGKMRVNIVNIKKNILKKAMLTVLFVSISLASFRSVQADAVDMKSYITFGADLRSDEKKEVMELLSVSEADLENYEIDEVTNQEEYQYLGEYLEDSVIGKRALSSVKVEKGEDGSGIGIETHNITYCSRGMYCNALITAGVEDAMITVAGPFNISGTAALVGVMKSYTIMTGEEMDAGSMDAANNELVVTGELGAEHGAEKAADLVAVAKQKVITGDLSSKEDIEHAIDEAAEATDITLTEEQKNEVYHVLDKIKDLDIDSDALKEQAKDIYDRIEDLGIDMDSAKSFFGKIGDFFADLGEKIADFFSGLFS